MTQTPCIIDYRKFAFASTRKELEVAIAELLDIPQLLGFAVFLVNDDKTVLTSEFNRYNTANGMEEMKNIVALTTVCSVTTCFNTRKEVSVAGTDADLREIDRLAMERLGVDFGLCLPLMVEQGCVGVLHLGSCVRLNIDFSEVADIVAHTYSRIAQMEARLASLQRAAMMNGIQEQFMELFSYADPAPVEKVVETFAQQMLNHFPFDYCGILLAENELLQMQHQCIRDDVPLARFQPWIDYYEITGYSTANVSDGATSACFLNKSRFVIPDVETIKHLPMSDKDRTGLNLLPVRTFIFLPVMQKDRCIGVVWLITVQSKLEVSASDCDYFSRFAAMLGGTLYFSGKEFR